MLLAIIAALLFAAVASAEKRVRDFCYVKGQEENTLHGLGLVVGLNGTGDSKMTPTISALAQMMKFMGVSLPGGIEELVKSRNVALVLVTATVPESGGRKDQALNCTVSAALNAKSLRGGMLVSARLLGQGVQGADKQQVFALAQGLVQLDDITHPTFGRIHNGCRLEAEFRKPFVQDGKITLVVRPNHAGFHTASDIAELIRTSRDFQDASGGYTDGLAKALNGQTIVVTIPKSYENDPVSFVSQVLDQQIFHSEKEPRVVINERSGAIVIGGDVGIGAVAVAHNGMAINTGTFTAVDPGEVQSGTKLAALVEALNAVKATPHEIIEILKGLDRNGQLYGRLIIE